MTTWVESHKPAANVPAHLLLAGLMWMTVGGALMGIGAHWLWSGRPAFAPWLAAAAIAVGVVKSHFVLDRAAQRVVRRITARGDGRCLGGFLSLRTWGLVVLMMVLGRVLRGNLTGWIIGAVYIAVGTALLRSSRLSWRAWRAARHEP